MSYVSPFQEKPPAARHGLPGVCPGGCGIASSPDGEPRKVGGFDLRGSPRERQAAKNNRLRSRAVESPSPRCRMDQGGSCAIPGETAQGRRGEDSPMPGQLRRRRKQWRSPRRPCNLPARTKPAPDARGCSSPGGRSLVGSTAGARAMKRYQSFKILRARRRYLAQVNAGQPARVEPHRCHPRRDRRRPGKPR